MVYDSDDDSDSLRSSRDLDRGSTSTSVPADETKSFLQPHPAPPADDDDQGIDPRLRGYPIPLVAKTVGLDNDETEPLLTIRFWILSTFWVAAGCSISSIYYFKPYTIRLSGYVVQLLAHSMGRALASRLPPALNPGAWNAKEHALVVAAYWGSTYTAYGLGPLSALELYYGRRMSGGWAVLFLMATQLMGYGFAGLYRRVLVRPPDMYYPGVLPNVALFRAMHRGAGTATAPALRFFWAVVAVAFVYQWLPGLVAPLLASLPVVCYLGAGDWRAFVLGSGRYGFGLLDVSLDWNYASFLSPLYTPLWANANRFAGAAVAVWVVYPLAYFLDVGGAQVFAPMSSGTWDAHGRRYNVSRILTPTLELNRTALDEYSLPHWSFSYAMHFFWGFAASTGVLTYALLFHGKRAWQGIMARNHHGLVEESDPYLALTAHLPRVPHWWYGTLLAVCLGAATAQLYGGEMQLPWWGLLVVVSVSAIFTLPSGILFGFTNVQIGMDYLAELLAGYLFPGKPIAVLASTVYGRQILEQCLNLVGDIKFAFYMKIPERELFVAQVYGTVLGPLVNWACMRLIIDSQGREALTGEHPSGSAAWDALRTKNFYSLSVVWGVLGPQAFFGPGSAYRWVCYGFLVGPLAVGAMWMVHRARPRWRLEERVNPVVMLSGAAIFPVYPTTNLTSSMAVAVVFMGYVYRYHGGWFSKYNYLLGAGLDCGTQLVQVAMIFLVGLSGVGMSTWWGNDAVAVDRCFPPADLPVNALN
ncbi:OPT oligopeptide transporter protein-domain-containing protein [Lasiosphaeria hispida]|uniref:OPT oligopeptide transporter protein-domain-containing protein n=1 Tax=Lasiosphaeria hispida TaxID=260671 RepID=A0AAJ0HDY3_9PEZI|nr:OPT oligopeptide transporter protein-domain-containing protein [Lasiosphaeria hispida]